MSVGFIVIQFYIALSLQVQVELHYNWFQEALYKVHLKYSKKVQAVIENQLGKIPPPQRSGNHLGKYLCILSRDTV